MSKEPSNPPALALCLLGHLCAERNREAITGDLIERFREGRSGGWFWRQVLAAILVGLSNQLRPQWTEIWFAAAGTALIWCPWELIFPSAIVLGTPIVKLMKWGAGLQWPLNVPFLAFGMRSGGWNVYTSSLVELMAALVVLPFFALLMLLRRTAGWVNALRFFWICATLFIAGDLTTVLWNASHPVVKSQSWALALQGVWIFAALLVSARTARSKSVISHG